MARATDLPERKSTTRAITRRTPRATQNNTNGPDSPDREPHPRPKRGTAIRTIHHQSIEGLRVFNEPEETEEPKEPTGR